MSGRRKYIQTGRCSELISPEPPQLAIESDMLYKDDRFVVTTPENN